MELYQCELWKHGRHLLHHAYLQWLGRLDRPNRSFPSRSCLQHNIFPLHHPIPTAFLRYPLPIHIQISPNWNSRQKCPQREATWTAVPTPGHPSYDGRNSCPCSRACNATFSSPRSPRRTWTLCRTSYRTIRTPSKPTTRPSSTRATGTSRARRRPPPPSSAPFAPPCRTFPRAVPSRTRAGCCSWETPPSAIRAAVCTPCPREAPVRCFDTFWSF
mmetsp:Transcript_14846/g.35725  ORF Transcript_14846/g.35725 Transcript_14846/m.35725 type:complete len:216 (-) Transcript_14846:1132-1779(-)